MNCLPPEMRADNMMCYIGHEGTYAPAHQKMCASLGHSIMVEASGSVGEKGHPTKPDSSIWLMTGTKDRQLVYEYWLSTLGHDIELEAHFAGIEAWKRAPFATYVVEQKMGDFILVPPLAAHQAWNRGTRTMKIAWNRTTIDTLDFAFAEAMPRARMVCRDEQYKNKAIVLFSLTSYSKQLKQLDLRERNNPDSQAALPFQRSKVYRLRRDLERLFTLFANILISEMFSSLESMELVLFDSTVTCSYCRCNIFNRFLTCRHAWSCLRMKMKTLTIFAQNATSWATAAHVNRNWHGLNSFCSTSLRNMKNGGIKCLRDARNGSINSVPSWYKFPGNFHSRTSGINGQRNPLLRFAKND